jgi:23S rRNA (adenine2030-N6)-methyltransferase
VDTHSGAGIYQLDHPQAQLNREHADGILRIEGLGTLPSLISDYLEAVSSFRKQHGALTYPGSPAIASRILRPHDSLRFHELHGSDFSILADNTSGDERCLVLQKEGLAGMIKAMPPPSRRALCLIDPSYEIKSDYDEVPDAIAEAFRRFSQGTYLLWYPLLAAGQQKLLKQRMEQIPAPSWLWVELETRALGQGMHGSGCWILNPPWELPKVLESARPALLEALGQDAHAAMNWQFNIP